MIFDAQTTLNRLVEVQILVGQPKVFPLIIQYDLDMKWTFLKTADRTDMLRQMNIPEEMIQFLVSIYPQQLDPKMRHIVWLGKQLLEEAKRINNGKDPRKFSNEEEKTQAWRAWSIARSRPAFNTTTISRILDWVLQTSPDLMSMDMQEALETTQNWHAQMEVNEEKQLMESYNDPSKVVFNLPGGWKIVHLEAEDCETEGDLMGHCVGGYARSVDSGLTQIYSLRDPKGYPHATIEIITETDRVRGQETSMTWHVQQIQGKKNEEPIDKYKLMIKKWLEAEREDGKEIQWENESEAPELDYIRDWEPPVRGERDEYGIVRNEEDTLNEYNWDWEDMIERALDESFTSRIGAHFIEKYAKQGIDAVIDKFDWDVKDKDLESAMKIYKELEHAAYKFQEKAYEKWNEWENNNLEFLPQFPDDDNFVDETGKLDKDKYQKAQDEYYKDIKFYEEDFPWYQFANYLFKEMMEAKERLQKKHEKQEVELEELPVTASWYQRSSKKFLN